MIPLEWQNQVIIKASLCNNNDEILKMIYEEFENGHNNMDEILVLLTIISNSKYDNNTSILRDPRYIEMETQYNMLKKK